MGNFHILWMVFFISVMGFYSGLVNGNFIDMPFNWGDQHSEAQGTGDDEATLVLDQTSGSGTESNSSFVFGSFEMLIKLVPGDSAGTVTAFYVYSGGETHDEIDFEFLGNISGQPYTIHTNIFTRGGGGREQQFKPWFDPTADFHNYTIHWDPSHIVWYVDSIPIRVYRNYENETIPYPNQQAMKVYSSIWNGDSWATRGGLEKIDWAKAPFISRLRRFRAWPFIYDVPLTSDELDQMNLIRNDSMVYDYCKDFDKFNGVFPGECFNAQY